MDCNTQRFHRYFFCALILAFTVCLADSFFISYSDDSYIFRSSLSLWGKIYLQMFAFFLNLLLCFFLAALLRTQKKYLTHLCAGIFNIIVFLYAISWEFYGIYHRFLSIGSLRFFVNNPNQIFLHIFQVNPFQIGLITAYAFLIPAVLYPFLKKVLLSLSGRIVAHSRMKSPVLIQCVLFVFFLISVLAFRMDRHQSLRRVMKNNMSPQAALLLDFFSFEKEVELKGSAPLELVWSQKVPWEKYLKEVRPVIQRVPVIVLVVESLRSDILRDGRVMPELYNLTQQSQFWPNAFTASSHSDYADVAILSSHYPLRSQKRYSYPKNIEYPRVLIYDILHQSGFSTAIFSAQNENWGKMRRYLDTGHIDVFFDSTSRPEDGYLFAKDEGFTEWVKRHQRAGKLDDAIVVAEATQWISQINRNDFFIYLNFQRSHFPYTWPDSHSAQYSPYEINNRMTFGNYPESKVPIMKNRYYNSLQYVDQQVGSLIRFLKEKGLYDKSLILVTSDQGQAFYEHNHVCHGAQLHNEVANIPIIIKAPYKKDGIRHLEFAQSIDIPPTICHLLKIDAHPAFQGRNLLNHSKPEQVPIFMVSQNRLSAQDVVILGKWKLIRNYDEERDFLYDLEEDFGEERDLIEKQADIAHSLRDVIAMWRKTQLEYYANRKTYLDFYPPRYFLEKSIPRYIP